MFLHNFARLRSDSYPTAVKKKVATQHAGRWLGLFHREQPQGWHGAVAAPGSGVAALA
jgi:hypothetical protein